MTLRELRLYHWKEATLNRSYMIYMTNIGICKDIQNNSADHYDKMANFHISCVQTLNDHVAGTAEEDFIVTQNKAV